MKKTDIDFPFLNIKSWIFIIVLAGSSICSFGQSSIKGKIMVCKQNFSFANVLLFNSDSSLVKWIVTDSSGEFNFWDLSPDDYLVSVSKPGYGNFSTSFISAKENSIIQRDIILDEVDLSSNKLAIKIKNQYPEKMVTDRTVKIKTISIPPVIRSWDFLKNPAALW